MAYLNSNFAFGFHGIWAILTAWRSKSPRSGGVVGDKPNMDVEIAHEARQSRVAAPVPGDFSVYVREIAQIAPEAGLS
jgi:hypothetical protein